MSVYSLLSLRIQSHRDGRGKKMRRSKMNFTVSFSYAYFLWENSNFAINSKFGYYAWKFKYFKYATFLNLHFGKKFILLIRHHLAKVKYCTINLRGGAGQNGKRVGTHNVIILGVGQSEWSNDICKFLFKQIFFSWWYSLFHSIYSWRRQIVTFVSTKLVSAAYTVHIFPKKNVGQFISLKGIYISQSCVYFPRGCLFPKGPFISHGLFTSQV